MTISELHEAFCNEAIIIRNYSPATIQLYQITFNLFRKYAEVQEVKEVTMENLSAFFFYGRTDRKWSPYRHLNAYKALKSFLEWCREKEYISVNPILKVPKPKLGKHLPKRISQEDANFLLEAIPNIDYYFQFERYRNHAFFAVLLLAGLRAQETFNLGLSDVNLEEGLISIKSGKGDKDRVVAICQRLKNILERYLIDRRRLKKESLYFFTSLWGAKKLTHNGLGRIVAKIKRITKIDFTPHRLRHTFATLMLEGGCDIFTLSKMLGHSDIKTTTIYLSTSIVQQKKEIHKHPLNNL